MSNLSTEEKIQILDKLKRSMAPCNEWDQDYPDDVKLEKDTEQFIEELQNEKKIYEVVFYYNRPEQGYDMLAVDKLLVRASSKKAAINKAASKTPETYTDVKATVAKILEAD
jgi:hypothetical protein